MGYLVPPMPVVRSRVAISVRCAYCGTARVDELDECPTCGARRVVPVVAGHKPAPRPRPAPNVTEELR